MENHISDKEKAYWVAFNTFEGIGPKRFKLLVDYYGCAENAWKAEIKELIEIGLGPELVKKFSQWRTNFNPQEYYHNLTSGKLFAAHKIFSVLDKKRADDLIWVKKYNRYILSMPGPINILTLKDKNYPYLLAQIPHPPPVLYFRGELTKNLFSQTIGIVGTRKATAYGKEVTKILTRDLVAYGFTIISGMARGIDTMAHQTSLESHGKTIAVLGSGIDIIYPSENKKLYEKIIENGVIISEFPPGMPPLPGNFPARNIIIAALSRGVIVAEGAKDSGSLITAKEAADFGREVFAVPGPITSPMAAAPAKLLKMGAKIVTNVTDVLEELGIKKTKPFLKHQQKKEIIGDTLEENKIIEILKKDAAHIDEIVRQSGFPTSVVGSTLSLMEVKGKVKNLGEFLYSLC